FLCFVGITLIFINRKKFYSDINPFYQWEILMLIQLVLTVCGVRMHREGMEQVPEGIYLNVSNHRSNFDPLVIMNAFGTTFAFLTKASNLKIPVAGPLARRNCSIIIDRDNVRESLKVILHLAGLMKDKITCGFVYPEGTRNQKREMLPFHDGVFKAAQKAGVPVVVSASINSDEIGRNAPFKPTHVYVKVCGVFSAEEVKSSSSHELSNKAQELIEAALAKYDSEGKFHYPKA
ncbi:MAG: 1-acyl-sn-glycerol-3-phosphate acyltransferase, partial [Parasporobacterium sp.]|nr:1-acyl-sn-glycerol-3-phosphate acyltransferase [Parasporobacterium sp.]